MRIFVSSLVLAGLLAGGGCGHSQNSTASLAFSARNAAAVADNDHKAATPKENGALQLHLAAGELAPDGKLNGDIAGTWGRDDAVRLLWIDQYNRVAAVSAVAPPEIGKNRVTFSVPLPPGALGLRHRLVLIRAAAAGSKDEAALHFKVESEASFRVKRPGGAPAYLAAMTGAELKNGDSRQRLQQWGLNCGFFGAGEISGELSGADTPFIGELLPPKANPLASATAWRAKVSTFETQRDEGQPPLRVPALFDDVMLEPAHSQVNRTLEASLTASPLAWSLGDKLSITHGAAPFDYDYSPMTLAVFRGWLEQKYNSLEALNLVWGTRYRKWQEVVPPTTDAVKCAELRAYRERLIPWLCPEPSAPEKASPAETVPTAAPAVAPPAPARIPVERNTAKPPPVPPGSESAAQSSPAKTPPVVASFEKPGAENAPPPGPFELGWKELPPPENENFAAWCDWREFNDFAFARLLHEMRGWARQTNPATPAGLTSAQSPAAFGGWDWQRVCANVDWLEEHQAPWTHTLAKSLAPEMRCYTRLSPAVPADTLRLWDLFLRGDSGCLLEESPAWTTPGAQTAAPALLALAPEFKAFESGLALQRDCGEFQQDPIAIYYSPQSLRVHWLLDTARCGSHWVSDPRGEAGNNSGVRQMEAWTALLEDLGYTPSFLSPEQLVGGQLAARQIKVLILPKVLSLSDTETRVLREFAAAGGVVIADGACGTFDGAGRRRVLWGDARSCGALDADFGIGRSNFIVNEVGGEYWGGKEPARVTLHDSTGSHAIGPDSADLRVLEPGLVGRGALIYATAADGAVALAENSGGLGRFFYLNLCLQNYPQLRAKALDEEFRFRGMSCAGYEKTYGPPSGGEALRLVIGDVLTEFLPEPALRVVDSEGRALRCVRRVSFKLGQDAELLGLVPNGQVSTRAAENAPVVVWLKLPGARHCYDLGRGVDLGQGPTVPVTLDPQRATLVAALPYAVERVQLKVRRTSPFGAFTLSATIETGSGGGSPGRHVLHLEIANAKGQVLPAYTRNIIAEKGAWSGEVLLGLNESVGNYRITVRDVLSGKSAQGDLLKDLARYGEVAAPR